MNNLNPFYVLKVSHTATDGEVREAYLNAVKKYPPERFPVEFNQITLSYKQIQETRQRLSRYLFALPPFRTLAEIVPETAPQRNRIPGEHWMTLFRREKR
ncbi:J domain-containing protein [Candidatus Sumerlaeota bacterium]|nr:J domain-containing protein [Candidatus Sumerlaeota bacterium]